MKKLTEMDKLKYWVDTEFTILHIMLYIVMWLLTHSTFVHVLLALLIVRSVAYMLARTVYLASADRNYLKVPKK